MLFFFNLSFGSLVAPDVVNISWHCYQSLGIVLTNLFPFYQFFYKYFQFYFCLFNNTFWLESKNNYARFYCIYNTSLNRNTFKICYGISGRHISYCSVVGWLVVCLLVVGWSVVLRKSPWGEENFYAL